MAAGQVIYSPQHIVNNPLLGQAKSSPDAAPSSAIMGYAIADPRVAFSPGSPVAGIQGFTNSARIKTIGKAPAAIATNNIAAAQKPVSGVPMTLVSSTAAGITVMASSFYCEGSGNTIPAGSLAIDGLPVYTTFGTGFISSFYNPSGLLSRAVSITAVAAATGGAFTISGADVYGYPMTQVVTAAAASTVNSLKAFKFIFSITPSYSDGSHNHSVGTSDVFGLPLVAPNFPDVEFYWDNVLGLFATYVAPDATTPATTATGDVRGTIAVGSASDGTKRLELWQAVTLSMLSNTTSLSVGMFGIAQV